MFDEAENMRASDVMSVDIIAATEDISAREVATRIVLDAINGMTILNSIKTNKEDGYNN